MNEPNWKDANDVLPPPYTDVWIKVYGKNYGLAMLTPDDDFWHGFSGNFVPAQVTHWAFRYEGDMDD